MDTHLVRISFRLVQPVRPIDEPGLLPAMLPQEMLIGGTVHLLDLVPAEEERLNRPVDVLDAVDLGRDRCDNAEIVARALESPPQIRVLADGLQGPVGENNVGGEKLVRHEPVVTLKPAMTASEGWSEVTDTFAGTRDYNRDGIIVSIEYQSLSFLSPA